MEDMIRQLEHENERLKNALKEIAVHQAEIQKQLDEISDILYPVEQADNTPVTEEDVRSLLKKYSRL